MDFALTSEQQAIGDVARQLFETRATPEHLSDLEAGAVRFDAELWKELAASDLLGIALPEAVGGSGFGFLELCVLLVEVGWSVAPVPAHAALVLGADPVARFGTDDQIARHLGGVVSGEVLLTAALGEPGRSEVGPVTTATPQGSGWRLDGAKELVAAAQLAQTILVPAVGDDGEVDVFFVDAAANGLDVRPVATTNGEPYADVVLDGVLVDSADRLGGPGRGDEILRSVHARAVVALCAVQLGVADRALRIAAEYTTGREQFGRPIGTFQAVQQRMADGFVDVEAIRWTMWYAAWLLAQDRPAVRDVSIAKFWAAEAGAHVVATAQQVHGGIGIDTSYPLFRYFLFAKQNELTLGSASAHLARLGRGYLQGER